MIKNYLKVAWRNITRNKIYTTINVLGLSLGMTCCLFILLWVQDEKSIDNFHRNGENLFSIYKTVTANGKVEGDYFTPLRLYKDGDAYRVAFVLEDLKQAIPDDLRVPMIFTNDFCNEVRHSESNAKESNIFPSLTAMVATVNSDLQVESIFLGMNNLLDIAFNTFCSSLVVCCCAKIVQLHNTMLSNILLLI